MRPWLTINGRPVIIELKRSKQDLSHNEMDDCHSGATQKNLEYSRAFGTLFSAPAISAGQKSE
jgi:hypothetical protein